MITDMVMDSDLDFNPSVVEKRLKKMTSQSQSSMSTSSSLHRSSLQASEKPHSDMVQTIEDEIRKSDCADLHRQLIKDKPSQKNPIVVIVAGPAGAGKSTVYKTILPKWFQEEAQYANVDTYTEHFLAKYNAFSNPSSSRPPSTFSSADIRRINAVALAKSTECAEDDLNTHILEKRHLIIDKPCNEATVTKRLIRKLRYNGYDVYMLVVYVSKETALRRGKERERQLPEKAIEKIWAGVHENLFRTHLFSSFFRKEPQKLIVVNNEAPSLTIPSEAITNAKALMSEIFPKKPLKRVVMEDSSDISGGSNAKSQTKQKSFKIDRSKAKNKTSK